MALCSLSFSQEKQITVNVKDLPPELVRTIEAKDSIASINQKIESYGKWVGLGKEIGNAVKGSLEGLTDQTDKFAKTGVGKFTMFIVAYKVLGQDILGVIIAIPLFLMGISFITYSFLRNCIPRSYLKSEDKEGKKTYEIIPGSDNDTERQHLSLMLWGHAIVFLILTLICSLIAF